MASPHTRLVAFLRGINVGGINIKMAALAAVFESLGLTGVRTVLASGNVVFDAPGGDRAALKHRIEAALSEAFGYEAWVILADLTAIARMIEAYPFDESDESKQPWVMFLSEPGVLDDLMSVADGLDPSVERLQPGDGVLYWEVTKGETTRSAFSKHSAKARFKATTTMRILRTLRKVLD
jgi:uncharacterized protein (DUF1697 family)